MSWVCLNIIDLFEIIFWLKLKQHLVRFAVWLFAFVRGSVSSITVRHYQIHQKKPNQFIVRLAFSLVLRPKKNFKISLFINFFCLFLSSLFTLSATFIFLFAAATVWSVAFDCYSNIFIIIVLAMKRRQSTDWTYISTCVALVNDGFELWYKLYFAFSKKQQQPRTK